MSDRPTPPDTISVPLAAEDFDLIDEALQALQVMQSDAIAPPHDAIAELRDRLKRTRVLP
jgi:hypothetical protein